MIFKGVQAPFDEINSTYAGKFSPDQPDYEAAESRMAAVEAKLKEVFAQVAAGQQGAANTEAQRQTQSEVWLAKLRPYMIGVGQPGHDEAHHFISSTVSCWCA